MTPQKRRIIISAAVVLVTAALIFVYGRFDPTQVIFPRCPFLALTGWQCPGCGSQRAAHALLQGRVGEAWGYNPVMVAILPFLLILLAAEALRTRLPRFYAAVNSRTVCLSIAILFIVWMIGRNLF